MSHLSAAALLDRVRHSEDLAVVERVLTLVETVGVDEIARTMERCRAGSLPGCAVATVYVAYVDAIESRLDRASVALK